MLSRLWPLCRLTLAAQRPPATAGSAPTGATPNRTTVELAADDGGPAERNVYAGTAPVEWWKLVGAGHSPPSRSVVLARDTAGVQNRDIEFAEVAWTFFAARLP